MRTSHGSSFGTKAGFVLLPDEPVVLHARSRGEALEAAWRLYAIGLLEIAGYVLEPPAEETLAAVDLAELERLLGSGDVQLVDVREASERDDGYIPGSRNIPYRLLRKLGRDALEQGRPIVTICESGARATIAASVLRRDGFDVRPVATGGIQDFRGEIPCCSWMLRIHW